MNKDNISKYINRLNRYVIYPANAINSLATYKVNTFGSGFSIILFIRLVSSFDSSIILIRKGYFIEVNSIFRHIFEQLCYCIELSDKSHENIEDVKVTKSIKSLKKVKSNYGFLYSYLSNLAHLDLYNINLFASFTEVGDYQMSINIKTSDIEHDLNEMNLKLLCILLLLFYDVGIFLLDKTDNTDDCISNIDTLKKKQLLVFKIAKEIFDL